MSNARSRIALRLNSLLARERRLDLLRSVAHVGTGVAATAVGMTLLSGQGLGASAVAFAGGAGAGLSIWLGAVLPLRARRGRGAVDMARRVEHHDTAFQGRLVTASSEQGPATSPELLDWIAERAGAMLERHEDRALVEAKPAWRAVGGSVAAWSVAAILGLTLPGGFAGAGAFGLGPLQAMSSDQLAQLGQVEEARVGDLFLRYIFPPYTGLDPFEVPNSTGEAHGPPGTQVQFRLRADQAIGSAAVVTYGGEPQEATAEDRVVSGGFRIQEASGSWQVLMTTSGAAVSSPEFPITVEPDIAPQVAVVPGDELRVGINQPLGLTWEAKDDFGVSSVVIELDGQVVGTPIYRARGRTATATGVIDRTPVALGLGSGQQVTLRVGAWDNDTVSGSKIGWSAPVTISVGGAVGQAINDEERFELLDLTLELLASTLTEPFPPGNTSNDLAVWGEVVSARFEPLESFVSKVWGSETSMEPEYTWVEGILLEVAEAVRFSQVAFFQGDYALPAAADVQQLSDGRMEIIAATEDAALLLEARIRELAIRKLVEATGNLDYAVTMLDSAKDNQSGAIDFEMRSVRRELELTAESGRLVKGGGIGDWARQRSLEVLELHATVQKQMETDPESVGPWLELLSDSARAIPEGVRRRMEDAQEKQQQQQNQAANLLEELRKLRDAEQALQDETRTARGEGSVNDRLMSLWEEVERRVEKVSTRQNIYSDELNEQDRPFNEKARVKVGLQELADLEAAVAVRDVIGARSALELSFGAWEDVGAGYRRLYGRLSKPPSPGAPHINSILRGLDEVSTVLDQLEQADQASPAARSKLREQSGDQEALQSTLSELRGLAEQVVREFPVTPRGLNEELDAAEERMDDAARELSRGRGMMAEGSEGSATYHLSKAIAILSDAMRKAQQSGGGEGSGGDGDPQGGSQGGDPAQGRAARIELPDPEEFQTPEEYRRALIEGMAGDVPEAYRALKKRYYEDLVQQ